MGTLGLWVSTGLLPLAAPAAATEPGRYPPDTILMVVASWCAPCHVELRHLPAITRDARPFRVLVVPFDARPATRAMVEAVPAAQRWQPDRAMRRRLAQDVAAGSSGLPFSLAIDGDGQPCGSARKGLDGPAARALVAGCRQSR